MFKSFPWAILIVVSVALFITLVADAHAQPVSLYVYYYEDCFSCMERMDHIVQPFYETHKNSLMLVSLSLNDQTAQQNFYEDFEADLTHIFDNKIDPPYVMLRSKSKTLRIYGENLTLTNLDKALENMDSSEQTTPNSSNIKPNLTLNNIAIVLSAGVFSGINPCLIAFTTYMTSASVQTQSQQKRAAISRALMRIGTVSAGVVAWYSLIGIAFHGIQITQSTTWKTAATLGLIGLGSVFMLSFKKADARLFKTPNFLKEMISTNSKKASFAVDFLLGVIFALIKTPCLVGPYLVVLSWLAIDASLAAVYVVLFNVGVVLPLFAIAGLLAFGIINVSKIDQFRVRERTIVRFLAGVLLLLTGVLLWIF